MPPLIEQHREAIRELCREFRAKRLELFGSAATDTFDPERSDVDFLVEYPEDYDFGPWIGRHFELQERLEELLGRSVDLIMTKAIRKPRFIQAVNQTRTVLYAA